jgi:MFS family permease
LSLVIVLPIVLFVFKNKPQDIGLRPDGDEFVPGNAPKIEPAWSRKGAMSTRQFHSLTAAFALGMMVQVGFLSSHVSLVAPISGNYGASIAVSSAALAAFIGRVALAQFADRIDLRLTTAAVMLLAAASLAAMAVSSTPTGLLLTSISYGLTIGNLTTLSPIISRREFGAASFGATYSVAAAIISFATAFGPGLFGVLRDFLGSYGPGLIVAAFLNLIAAVIIIWGGRKPLPSPS